MKRDRPRRYFRAVYEDFEIDPLPSRSSKGRFHDEQTHASTTYLAANEETAWKEVTFRWHADPTSYRMAHVTIELQNVVDLTDHEIQRRYGVNEEILTGNDYGPTQRLARRLRAERVEGFFTYSKADQPDGRQLVVFLDLLGPRSSIHVEDVREVRPKALPAGR